MIAGTICGLAHGAGLPMLMIVFGDMVDLFLDSSIGHKALDTIDWSVYGTTKEDAVSDLDTLEYVEDVPITCQSVLLFHIVYAM